jgi:hypothetical protein
VFLDDVFIPYLLENGIYVLPPEKRVRHGLSLFKILMEYKNERPVASRLDPPDFRERKSLGLLGSI